MFSHNPGLKRGTGSIPLPVLGSVGLNPSGAGGGVGSVVPSGLMGAAQAYVPTVSVGTACLLYTSPSPRDGLLSRMPSSA